MESFEVHTAKRSEFRDITSSVSTVVRRAGVTSGLAVVYVPHTTAGVTINENADPSVIADIQASLEKLVPWDEPFFRHGEGNSAAHIKASMMGSSAQIPIDGGHLVLGTWQGIYFCEFDGPRTRKVHVQIIGA
jgi:secondary thiamine-phosphate synthase enzyme